MPESRGKGLKPPKVVYNLKFLGLYAFSGISFSYLKLTYAKPLYSVLFGTERVAQSQNQSSYVQIIDMGNMVSLTD